MLSARGSTIDRIAGLEDGADDYLPKPFSPAELVLRVKSILRRTASPGDGRPRAHAPSPGAPSRRPHRRPRPPRGPPRRPAIHLTRVEFRLLSAILGPTGRVLTRDQLLDAVYGQDRAEVLDRTIDVHIGRLRDKLDDDPDAPRYVADGPRRRLSGRAAVIGPRDRRPDRAGGHRLGGGRARDPGDRRRGRRGRRLPALMMEAGDSAEHAQGCTTSRSRPSSSPRRRRGVASIGLAIVLARMLARPLAEIGGAARRIADGDYAPASRARAPRSWPASPTRSTRWRPRLERQEAMRRDFIANAAHELRTPLTNLQGYLEALRDGVITADRATYESLHEEAERLVRLSRSLDALAEGDAATEPAADRRAGPRRRHPDGAGPRGADDRTGRTHVVTDVPPSLPARADPDLLAQVLANLLSNAVRYTPAGGVVTVRAERRPATSWCRSPTPATASRPRTSTASSSASTGSRSRATGRAVAPASGWPS